MTCGAQHPIIPGLVCIESRPNHPYHSGVYQKQGARGPMAASKSWPNPDFIGGSAKGAFGKILGDIQQGRPTEPVVTAPPTEAITSYGDSSGWSGSDTSRERAEEQDANGITAASQRLAFDLVSRGGVRGATVAEIRTPHTDMHHGKASGALTNLHKAGYITRLAEVKRDKCAVYVLPEHVDGRATVAAE